MRYKQQLDYRRRKRFIRRVWLACLIVVLMIGGFVGYLFYENYKASNYNSPEQTTSTETSGYFGNSVNILRSQYFQFQADKNWVEVPAESTPTKFVYRSFSKNLVEHELIVYVGEVPATIGANRLLPVEVRAGNGFGRQSVSNHCAEGAKSTNAQNTVVKLQSVMFECDSDSTDYSILVGEINGSTKIPMNRPDKSVANYTISYKNLRATGDPSQIYQIIDTFQTR